MGDSHGHMHAANFPNGLSPLLLLRRNALIYAGLETPTEACLSTHVKPFMSVMPLSRRTKDHREFGMERVRLKYVENIKVRHPNMQPTAQGLACAKRPIDAPRNENRVYQSRSASPDHSGFQFTAPKPSCVCPPLAVVSSSRSGITCCRASPPTTRTFSRCHM